MELGMGQKYNALQNSFTVATTATPVDLITLTSVSNVPIYIERIVLTSNANAAAIQAIQLVRRSTVGTGGTSGTLTPEANAAPTASSTFSYNVTTPGTLKNASDPEIWQMFAPYEFNRKPGALLIVPGETFAINVTSVGSSFVASVHIELIEVK